LSQFAAAVRSAPTLGSSRLTAVFKSGPAANPDWAAGMARPHLFAGRWRDPRSAARYAHVVSHEEWARTDLLPMMGKSVELPAPKPKTKVNQ
jgi:hypothetical protein